MRVSELTKYGVPEKYVQKIIQEKIENLYPPQADIIRKNLLGNKNLVVAVPTAGGKTLIAALAMIKKFSEEKCKAVYIAPLVALAGEKHEYFKEMFGDDYKVALSVGKMDSADPWLADRDIIVSTTEKLDSLTRHAAGWMSQAGLIIVDEIHMINDPHRGPTLEVLLTKLRDVAPKAQVIGLSATIANAAELAKWLNANLVVSDFRPTKLHEGVTHGSRIHFYSHKTYELDGFETEAAIMRNTMHLGKQALFFLSTRRNAESLAEKLAPTTAALLTEAERSRLSKTASDVLDALESPTKQCQKLAFCIRHGTAFHHAGLVGKQKRIIEDEFRKGTIKAITSTPTLAMGVNLPAFRVVIRDAKRFYSGIGSAYIPVMEYKQMAGRAGRPKYDDFGESILVAKSEDEASELLERFVNGEMEAIRSKLAVEPVLRTHVLALIASGFVDSEESLLKFFGRTFYSFQYGDRSAIEEKLADVIGQLVDWGFLDYSKDMLKATDLGRRVSELYIDPLTAHKFTEDLEAASKRDHDYFSLLHAVCESREMEPKLSLKSGEFADIGEQLTSRKFLHTVPEEWDLEFDDFVRSLKTATLFDSWMKEQTDDQILADFNIPPGEMRNRIETADWLVYSMQEICLLMGQKSLIPEIRKLRVRMKYGIREELVPLVRLEQVGRFRARKLYKSGLKTLEDLRRVPIQTLSKIVGEKVAKLIKKQVGETRIASKSNDE